jgi:hypothetical protein
MVEATADHVFYLCRRMRPDEIEQLRAFYAVDKVDGSFDADAVAVMLLGKRGPRYTIYQPDGFPAVSFGLDLVHDGVWQPWMVGTLEGWESSWRSITRGCRWVRDALFSEPANRRLQMSALVSRAGACHWYEKGLGMSFEGVMRGYGRNGEDIALYSVLRGT